jgi:MFS family permease
MNSNIYKYYSYSAISNFLFFLPIVYVFFQDNGLSLTQIFIIEAIFSIGLVLFEVPTGAVADYYGKKASLVLGSVIWVISCVLFSFGSGFYTFIFAYLTWALGAAFLSGADTALLYDILHKDNQKEHFKKYQGNAKFIGLVAISLASLLGGYIASFSMRYTFIASAIAFFAMFFLILAIAGLPFWASLLILFVLGAGVYYFKNPGQVNLKSWKKKASEPDDNFGPNKE